jgi:ribosomal protein S18 acetylase RimI-like enzyme
MNWTSADACCQEAREDVRVDVVVRLADRDLAPVLAELHRESAVAGYGHIFPQEAAPPSYDEVLNQWTHWLGRDSELGRRAFVAYEGDTVVGVVLAGPDPHDPRRGHVARLYVTPRRWGAGIGRKLYCAALEHLRGAGFAEATLWVLERNDRARSWYERLGWRATGERKTVYAAAGIDDLRYSLGL